MIDNMIFARRLRNIRKIKRISQNKLAKALGVSLETESIWESSEKEPSYEMLRALATYFGVSTDYLLGYIAEEPTNFDVWKQTLTPEDINKTIILTCKKCPAAGVTCFRYDYGCKRNFYIWAAGSFEEEGNTE